MASKYILLRKHRNNFLQTSWVKYVQGCIPCLCARKDIYSSWKYTSNKFLENPRFKIDMPNFILLNLIRKMKPYSPNTLRNKRTHRASTCFFVLMNWNNQFHITLFNSRNACKYFCVVHVQTQHFGF